MNKNHNHQFMELESPWLDVVQAAQYLRVKPKTLYNWKSQGKIKTYSTFGSAKGGLRFLKTDLDKVLNGNKKS